MRNMSEMSDQEFKFVEDNVLDMLSQIGYERTRRQLGKEEAELYLGEEIILDLMEDKFTCDDALDAVRKEL